MFTCDKNKNFPYQYILFANYNLPQVEKKYY